MKQFLKYIKGLVPLLALLLGLGASAQGPEYYSGPWSNSGYIAHGVGTGINAFTIAAGGSYDGTGGTDAFPGPGFVNGNQEIAGSVAPVFGTLVLNNGTGFLLSITNTADAFIANGLTFTSGIIDNRALGVAAPLGFLSTATSPTASATSYVNGYVSKTGTTAFTFPIGDLSTAPGNRYHPLSMGTASGSTTVTAAYIAGATPNNGSLNPAILAVDPSAYWDFSSSNSASSTITITARDETGVFPAGSNLFVAGFRISTGKWENVTGSFTPITGANQVLSSNIINMSFYSGFTVGAFGFPLPVTLISFTGEANGCDADLSWQSAIEQNNDHYEIELSADGAHFSAVGEVKSQNSPTGASYSYHYAGLSSHVGYFRLAAVDKDGKYSYSQVVAVTGACNLDGKILVFPNPATDLINIQGLEDGVNHMVLFDAAGRKLSEIAAPGASQHLNISSYSRGIYILRIMSANKTVTNIKIIKK
jgi:hypothetical protein